LTAAEALDFPAIQLFVERAHGLVLTDADVPSVARVCAVLDGIPLAIELAAARVATFGVRTLATLLDDRLRLLATERRGVLPRHRTLAAALEWSFRLLDAREQRVLELLASFSGHFDLAAAQALVPGPELPGALASLVAKSLVVCEPDATYRLLETTRAFALSRRV
jgi:predicted ATPase